jgi:hypothetical protein
MSIFPFIDSQAFIESQNSETLPRFAEYAFNFETGTFLLHNEQQYLVYENEALKIWVYHALAIPRYRHLAFTRAYGSEMYTLFGNVSDNGILQSEVKRFIIEALMVNPYIVELRAFTFHEKRDTLYVEFECETVYGFFNHSHNIERAA